MHANTHLNHKETMATDRLNQGSSVVKHVDSVLAYSVRTRLIPIMIILILIMIMMIIS